MLMIMIGVQVMIAGYMLKSFSSPSTYQADQVKNDASQRDM